MSLAGTCRMPLTFRKKVSNSRTWRARPPSSSPFARVAWDLLTEFHAPWTVVKIWYAPEMDDGAWCAEFENGKYRDVDVLVVNQARDKLKVAALPKKPARLESRAAQAFTQVRK